MTMKLSSLFSQSALDGSRTFSLFGDAGENTDFGRHGLREAEAQGMKGVEEVAVRKADHGVKPIAYLEPSSVFFRTISVPYPTLDKFELLTPDVARSELNRFARKLKRDRMMEIKRLHRQAVKRSSRQKAER
eukprot:ANDGO_07857.mRNA.1 hypothetical protein